MWHGDPKIVKNASPLHHASKSGPPTLIYFTAGDTRVRKEVNEEFADVLKTLGHPNVRFLEIPNRTHNTIGRFIEEPNGPTTDAMLRFMRRFLN